MSASKEEPGANSRGTGAGEATFARDLGLFDATMIGVGAMIGARIFVHAGKASGVIGAAKEPVFRKMHIGEIPQKVARYSLVKRYEGPVKTLFKRIMG